MKISIVMPVYNAAPYLREAVESIFANVCSDVELEIILVDDCSTDPATCALLGEYEARTDMKVLRQTSNGGPAKARNRGIRAATGDWIGFLDADDMMAPGNIALRRDVIARIPSVRWLVSDLLEMRKVGELTHFNSFNVDGRNAEEILPGIHQIRRPTRELIDWPMLPPLGAMFVRRDLLGEIGFFCEDLHYGEDNHFCLLASTHADLIWITHPCFYLRRHHESMTKNLLRMACEAPRYTRKLLGEPRLQDVRKQLRWQHASSLRHMSRISLAHNQRRLALLAAIKSILWTPNSLQGFRLALDALLPRRAT